MKKSHELKTSFVKGGEGKLAIPLWRGRLKRPGWLTGWRGKWWRQTSQKRTSYLLNRQGKTRHKELGSTMVIDVWCLMLSLCRVWRGQAIWPKKNAVDGWIQSIHLDQIQIHGICEWLMLYFERQWNSVKKIIVMEGCISVSSSSIERFSRRACKRINVELILYPPLYGEWPLPTVKIFDEKRSVSGLRHMRVLIISEYEPSDAGHNTICEELLRQWWRWHRTSPRQRSNKHQSRIK